MSGRPPFRHESLTVFPATLDAIVSECRRRDAGEAAIVLERWSAEVAIADPDDFWSEDKWLRASTRERLKREQELTDWVIAECRLHIAGGRFEHALCLLERYRFWPVAFSSAEADRQPQRSIV